MWKRPFRIAPESLPAAVLLWATLLPGSAAADGRAEPWGLGMQDAGTALGSRINAFHDLLLAIIVGVVVLVLGLLVYVMWRFNRARHPHPGRTTHNLRLEIAWTVIPCLIVLWIAAVAFPLLYDIERMPQPDLTLKVTSHQWYWSYGYPDRGDIAFDSLAIWDASEPSEADASALVRDASAHWLIQAPPQRMLEVDRRVVLPVGKVVRVQIIGADVLHSWFVPSLGINRMAVTGRLNEVWLKIEKPGLYYGQCSMICGLGHGFMPIVVEAVPAETFESWADSVKTASVPASRPTPSMLAAAIAP